MSSELVLAQRVVELVRRLAGAAVEAEAYVDHTAQALTRFANSAIHQNVADAATAVQLRLHVDGRTAAGSTTITDRDGLRALVERTLDAARHCPVDPGWPGLTPPAPAAGTGFCDEATARAEPGERAARVRAFVDAAGGLETAGFCRTTYWSAAFANTAGQSVHGSTAEAAMDGVARRDGADGVARLATARLSELDGTRLGAAAAAKARAGADAVELPRGAYEVVLEPDAVADLLENLGAYGFSGKAFAERRSFVTPGARQFDPAVTIVDDALDPTGSGMPFDAEGTPRRRTALVEAGVTRTVCHDRRTAAEVGAASTGHATGSSAYGPMPANLSLLPGPTGAEVAAHPAGGSGPIGDPAAAALVAGVERGLLVTDFWYTRVLDPKSLVVTGLTRNGVWLVEDGEVSTPVRNLRFTQSYPLALAPGAVRGVGRRATRLPDRWGRSWWNAPPLHLAGWNFTGGASG